MSTRHPAPRASSGTSTTSTTARRPAIESELEEALAPRRRSASATAASSPSSPRRAERRGRGAGADRVGLDARRDLRRLRQAADSSDQARGALVQRVRERNTQIETELLFFDLEWSALDDEVAERAARRPGARALRAGAAVAAPLQAAPALRARGEDLGREEPHRRQRLGPALQRARLRPQRLARRAATSRSTRRSPSSRARPTRRSAAGSPRRSPRRCGPGVRTRGYVLNTILNERAIEDRLRGYETWISARNLANEIPDEAAQSLVDAIQARYDIPQRFYALKARLLGLDRLKDYDRFAPLQEVGGTIAWEEAREIVLDAFNGFSPQAGEIVGDFFEKDWIDAALRPGKMLGAFCATTVPGVHPYVLMNYAGRAAERAHARARARPRPARLAGAGARPPERAHAADARRDGVRLRRGAHLREAEGARGRPARAARPPRRPDRRHRRDRLPPDRDEPLRARDPHRPPRGGRADGRADLRALEHEQRGCSATPSR